MVSQAVPSITPARAAEYVQKTECFCFQQQPLAAGESKQMNMVFTISPELPEDIQTVSMVYTLFDSTEFADPETVAKLN
jgi:cytochrome c oxidase assembly protein subunit 11